MRALKLPLAAVAGTLMIAPAVAQDAVTQEAPAAEAPQAEAPATVTDAEVDQFATAVVEVDRINKDATVAADAKQTQMAAAVTASGLTPERFNSIAQQMNADSELQAKVGTAIQAKAPAAAAPAPAEEPAPTPTPGE